jgi:PAS domain S-box-containing protein
LSTPSAEPKNQAPLRDQAEALLKQGAAPSSRGWITGVDALALLHRLAGTPANAGDALKLLHELQVHQVELDLQHEQLEQSRIELSESLDRYVELYDFAPVGYFTLDHSGKIIEGNLTGADLLDVARSELSGRRIESFVTPASQPALLALLEQLRNSGSRQTGETQTGGANDSGPRNLQVVASVSRNGRSLLLALMDAGAGQMAGAHS